MSYDYFAELIRRGDPGRQDVDAVTVHYHYRVATEQSDAVELREGWKKARLAQQQMSVSDLAFWPSITNPAVELAHLPPYASFIQLPIRLTKPYLSKDERAFYIVDNPIRRDRVFQLPYVAPSSWKGSLRAALRKLAYDEAQARIRRLFGNEKKAEEGFRAGRLCFFPTFFHHHGLEIINPHDRERKVGKNPILFESVPAGATGVFSLLYLPFDRVGQDEVQTRLEVAEDLMLLAAGLPAMLCVYGFGAKTSSGYGAVVENFVVARERKRDNLPDGRVSLNAVLGEPLEVRTFREKYGKLDELSLDEWRDLLDDKFNEYEVARDARERYHRCKHDLERRQVSCVVENLAELVEMLKAWAAALREEVFDGLSDRPC